jgi:hypothetical protein
MLSNCDIDLDPSLLIGFQYWVPTEENIADAGGEGLGFFRDTWLLGEIEHEEPRQVVT